MYAAKEDGRILGGGGFISQAERITHEISHPLDVFTLVIMSKNDGVFGFLERDHFFL